MTTKQSCKTCIHSRWDLTPTGRIRTVDSSGSCVVTLPIVNLPDSVTEAYGYQKNPSRCGITAEMGKNCPLYSRNHGSLIKKGVA